MKNYVNIADLIIISKCSFALLKILKFTVFIELNPNVLFDHKQSFDSVVTMLANALV